MDTARQAVDTLCQSRGGLVCVLLETKTKESKGKETEKGIGVNPCQETG